MTKIIKVEKLDNETDEWVDVITGERKDILGEVK